MMQISKLFYTVAQALVMTTLLTGVAIAGQTHKSVPTVFQGEWIEDLSKCGSVDDTKLKMAGKHIYFYESHGPIQSIKTEGKADLYLIVNMSGEGEKWKQSLHFRLSDDQKRLTDIADDNSTFVRYRCPSAQAVSQELSSDYKNVKKFAYNRLKKEYGNEFGKIVINKVSIDTNYAMVGFFVGEGGGSYTLKKTAQGWQILQTYGDDWGKIQRIVKDGVPRPIAENLLNDFMPDWKKWE